MTKQGIRNDKAGHSQRHHPMSLRGAQRRGNLTQRWQLTVRSPHSACIDKAQPPRLLHCVRNDKARHSQRHHPMSLRGAKRRGNLTQRWHTTPRSPHSACIDKAQPRDCVTTFAMTKQGIRNSATPCHCEELYSPMSLRGAQRRGNLTQRWHLTVRSPHFACTDKTPTPRLRHCVRNDKAGHSQRHHPMSLRGALFPHVIARSEATRQSHPAVAHYPRSPHSACIDKAQPPRLRHYVRNDKAGHSQPPHVIARSEATRQSEPAAAHYPQIATPR